MSVFLRQSTAIDVRVGPFVDVGDGFTPETGVTIGASDEAEILKADGAATVIMAGAFAAVTDCDGWYDYTISATDTDAVGELVVVMQDLSVYLPVFMRFYVVEEAVYDAMYAASAVGPAAEADIADAVWDEDIEAAHGGDAAAGLLLRALGAAISNRSNNATLNALLGVADSAGEDVPSQILDGDTMAELADAIPAATPTLREFAMLLYHLTRDESTTTAELLSGKNDAGATIFKQTLADDATTMTRSEMVAGT